MPETDAFDLTTREAIVAADLLRVLHCSYLSINAWCRAVGSHPLGHTLVFHLDPEADYVGYVCKTCNFYLSIQKSEVCSERYLWPMMQKNPEGLLRNLQSQWRVGLTIWDRLNFTPP
jgi:hypothetical protein